MRARRFVWSASIAMAVAAVGTDARPDDPAPGSPEQLVRLLEYDTSREDSADKLYELGAAAVPPLVAGFANPEVRDAAIDVLDRLGPAAKEAVPALTAVVQDAANRSRRTAARALASIGADATSAIPALTSFAADAKAGGQVDAADAIGRIAVEASRKSLPKSPAAAAVKKSIDAGLEWLARHQTAEGSWSTHEFAKRCAKKPACAGAAKDDYEVGATGLAVLSFLGAGETPRRGRHRALVRAGLAYLVARQSKDGLIGKTDAWRPTYVHACAALALSEAYRATKHPDLQEPVQRAVAFIQTSQNPGAGWRYALRPTNESDTSVTVWMTRVLACAAGAGIQVDAAALKGAAAWVDTMTEPEFGRTGYQQRGGPPARFEEKLEEFPPDRGEPLTAAAVVIRLNAGRTLETDGMLSKSAGLVAAKPPKWGGPAVDFYLWMNGSEALRRIGGEDRTRWNRALVETLPPHQTAASQGCAGGSWDPVDPWGDAAGRVYSTTMAILALENWTDEPPAKKPILTASLRSAIWALEKVLKSPDEATRSAAQRALDAIHGAFALK